MAGSYLYVVLLLTQRAFRRDVTTGVALWIATMFVAGPLMAGVFSLFWSATPGTSSVGVDVVYLVAGMLPRQFATIAQDLARRLLQPSVPTVPGRTIPLTTVRGINAEIEERLAEEGINDVATLAYADPYLLLRTTSFDRRQIVNWIDEAQLVMWFPDHWQALEKNGFTGAMDVAWAHGRPTLAQLATEIKIPQTVLEEAALRLSEDAQIQDLYAIYWEDPRSVGECVSGAHTGQTCSVEPDRNRRQRAASADLHAGRRPLGGRPAVDHQSDRRNERGEEPCACGEHAAHVAGVCASRVTECRLQRTGCDRARAGAVPLMISTTR